MFVVAVAAVGKGAVVDDAVPESIHAAQVGGVAGEEVVAGEADELGDLGVAVFAVEDVAALLERVEDGVVVEDGLGELEVFGLAGVHGEVGEDLVEAAELGLEDFLGLGGGEFFVNAGEVVGETALDLEGLLAAGMAVGVAQAGEDLVQGVVGHPFAVEVEAGGLDLAGAQFLVDALGDGEEVAVAVGLLAGGEFGDDVVHAFLGAALDGRVGGGGGEGGDGGEVVAEAVAVDTAGFPAAVAFGFFGEAGLLAEAGEEAVGVHDVEEVAGVDVLTVLEGAGQEVDVVEGEGLGLERNGSVGGTQSGGAETKSEGDEGRKGTIHNAENRGCSKTSRPTAWRGSITGTPRRPSSARREASAGSPPTPGLVAPRRSPRVARGRRGRVIGPGGEACGVTGGAKARRRLSARRRPGGARIRP